MQGKGGTLQNTHKLVCMRRCFNYECVLISHYREAISQLACIPAIFHVSQLDEGGEHNISNLRVVYLDPALFENIPRLSLQDSGILRGKTRSDGSGGSSNETSIKIEEP